MKKIWVEMVVAFLLLAVIAVAADQQSISGSVITTKMHARGKVIEISATTVKIERLMKDNIEIMQFELESPTKDIFLNDSVKIDYSPKEGKLSASRVHKIEAPKKTDSKGR